MLSLDQYLSIQEDDEAREEAIETLAEQMIVAAMLSTRDVLRASAYEITKSDILSATDHDEAFNEIFYAMAEKFVDSK